MLFQNQSLIHKNYSGFSSVFAQVIDFYEKSHSQNLGSEILLMHKDKFMTHTTELKPRVLMVNGLVLTTSLAVAAHFEKRHDHVISDIRAYVDRQTNREFVNKHFIPDSYINERGKTYESYRLTEQAFALISFGFTGAKAEAWQIAYVEAFTAMKAHITDKAASAAAEQSAKYLEQSELLRLQLSLAEKNLQVVTAECQNLIHVLRNKYRHNGPTGYKVERVRLLEVLRGFDQDWKEHMRRTFPFVTSHGRPADKTIYPSNSSFRNWFGATPPANKPAEG